MRADFILSFALGAIFFATLIEVAQYRWEVALAPGLAAALGLTFILVDGVKSLRAKVTAPHRMRLAEFQQFSWLFVATGAVILAGFGIGGGAYVFLYVLFMRTGNNRFLVALTCALAVPVVVFGMFAEILQIRLFPGVLFR